VDPFINENWLGLLGILIGVIGLVACFYVYNLSKSTREPVFLVDPTRTEIIDSERFSETPLQIIRPNGDEIKGDITSALFYFWNKGKKPIKFADILEPISIHLRDDKGEILDYKILKISRKITHLKIERNLSNPKSSLVVSFNILEQNDGMTCQLIYKGKPTAVFSISGTIEGVKKISTAPSFTKWFWVSYLKPMGGTVLLLAGLWLIGSSGKSPHITAWDRIFSLFSIGFFIAGCLLIIALVWFDYSDKLRKAIMEMSVPQSIRP